MYKFPVIANDDRQLSLLSVCGVSVCVYTSSEKSQIETILYP